MEEYTLHDNTISGNAYKIRLTAALLGIKLKLIEYDLMKKETRTPEFLSKINANGRIPVLQIGNDTFLPEGNAACHYLAASSPLIPTGRLEHAQMLQWMFFEQYSHEPAIAVLRSYAVFPQKEAALTDAQRQTIPDKRKAGEDVLDVMEQHLSTRTYFVAEKLTLADIALYAYTHVAHDAKFDLNNWPNIKAWCERVSQTPGYIPMT